MGWRGLLAGGLALIALQTVVANPQAAGRLGGLATTAGDFAQRFLSPDVPGFPRRSADVPVTQAPSSPPPVAIVDLLKKK